MEVCACAVPPDRMAWHWGFGRVYGLCFALFVCLGRQDAISPLGVSGAELTMRGGWVVDFRCGPGSGDRHSDGDGDDGMGGLQDLARCESDR